jgi:3-deoxy-manno-octulosonate cytidylyltransferase (CMP-KDO synthetase)
MGKNFRMNYLVVIPARKASSRLPGKPMVDILGKSMIRRTYEQCTKAVAPNKVVVATDDEEIINHCENQDMNAIMTSPDCLTGTDRIAEVAERMDADYYINVQGDEPVMNPADITRTIDALNTYPGEIINGFAPIEDEQQYWSKATPKLVLRPDGRLLYMSRAPIPGNKTGAFNQSWRQVCVYAYPKQSLREFAGKGAKTPLEAEEDLEILRFLEMGYEVRMVELSTDSIAVDLPEDVERVKAYLQQKEKA